MDKSKTSRRGFLAAAAAGSVFTLVPRYAVAASGARAPSERLNIAGIGVGGMGGNNIENCAKENNIVALCDVDPTYAAKTFAKYPNAKIYKDYRKMLDEQKDIDGITTKRAVRPR